MFRTMAIDLTSLSQPHNNLMLAILSDPVRARSVLEAHLADWIVERIADELPVPLDGSFVDKELRGSQTDKLFRVRFRNGRPGLAYVLFEHKSRPYAGTALLIHRYKARIWETYAQGRADRLRALPPIIPVVIYHGREPWSAPLSVADMLADQDERMRALEPSFGYFLRDLGKIPVTELAEDPAARAGLTALRYSHAGDGLAEEKLAALEEMLAGLPDGTDYERQVVVYILNVWRVPEAVLREAAARAKPGRGEGSVGEVIQELIDQGMELGVAKGMRMGVAEGVANSLRQLLEHKFGSPPESVLRLVAEASPPQIDAWFMAALDARSLAEVFGGLPADEAA